MDGIETKVYCPACKAVIELCLRKNAMDELMKVINHVKGVIFSEPAKPSQYKDIRYFGRKECSCGKVIEINFSVEAHAKRSIFQRDLKI
jgi:hypothetical protein